MHILALVHILFTGVLLHHFFCRKHTGQFYAETKAKYILLIARTIDRIISRKRGRIYILNIIPHGYIRSSNETMAKWDSISFSTYSIWIFHRFPMQTSNVKSTGIPRYRFQACERPKAALIDLFNRKH